MELTRKERVIDEAKKMSGEMGAINITREMLCDRADIPSGSFHFVMGNTFEVFIEEFKDDNEVPISRRRVGKNARKKHILNSAVLASERVGYSSVTRQDVADEAGISGTLVTHYYPSMHNLRRLVVAKAIKTENLTIIAQGLALKHPGVMEMPLGIRERAAKSLVS